MYVIYTFYCIPNFVLAVFCKKLFRDFQLHKFIQLQLSYVV